VPDVERDDFIESIASELRRPVRFDSGFDARVMSALDPAVIAMTAPERQATPGRPWFLRPRTFSLSPLAGFAAAAGLVGVLASGTYLSLARTRAADLGDGALASRTQVSMVPAASASAFVQTPFLFPAPGAKSVALVGDFNGWDTTATPMKQVSNDTWTVTLPLKRGRHEYQVVVDGLWMYDPSAAQVVQSEFGGNNSVVVVR
jgi:hypothetical protein